MGKTITNAVLAEKIDSLASSFKEVKHEVQLNTEFRLKTTGIISLLCGASVFIGAITTWLLTRIYGE